MVYLLLVADSTHFLVTMVWVPVTLTVGLVQVKVMVSMVALGKGGWLAAQASAVATCTVRVLVGAGWVSSASSVGVRSV